MKEASEQKSLWHKIKWMGMTQVLHLLGNNFNFVRGKVKKQHKML